MFPLAPQLPKAPKHLKKPIISYCAAYALLNPATALHLSRPNYQAIVAYLSIEIGTSIIIYGLKKSTKSEAYNHTFSVVSAQKIVCIVRVCVITRIFLF